MTASPLHPHPRARTLSLRERARAREGRAELLLFRIGAEHFATELTLSEEAIELSQHALHPVPGRVASRLGVVNLRGALMPLYTPAPALGIATPPSPAMAVIFPTWSGSVAIAVDEVEDVLTADLSELRDAPGQARGLGSAVLGAVHHSGRLIALLDADALIAACRGEGSAPSVSAPKDSSSGARQPRALKLETT